MFFVRDDVSTFFTVPTHPKNGSLAASVRTVLGLLLELSGRDDPLLREKVFPFPLILFHRLEQKFTYGFGADHVL